MSSEAVINPCSPVPAVSPQAGAFASGKFPPMVTMPPQDAMSHFQDLRQQPQLLQLPSQQLLADPPQQYQQLAESISPLEQHMDQLRINQTVYLQPQQQQQQSKQAPPSHSLEPSTQQLVSTPVKEKLSRCWPLAGRFFEKRKSVTEPPHIPNSQTLATDNSLSVTDLSTSMPQQPAQPANDENEKSVSFADSGVASVPGNENNNRNSSRRGSMADIPKALLSSLRRASLSSNSNNNNSNKNPNVNGDIAEEDDEDYDADEHQVESGRNETPKMTTILCADGLRQATMAIPKGPPTRAAALPYKSILKKQPSPTPSSNFSPGPGYGTLSNRLHENVYQIVPSDKDVNISLLTHSSAPNHEHMLSPPRAREINASITSKALLISPGALDWLSASPLSRNDRSKLENDRSMSHRAATPPDLGPGMQSSNCQGRGGEHSQGQVMNPLLGDRGTTRYFRMSPHPPQQQSMTTGAHINPLTQDLSIQHHNSQDSGSFAQQLSSWPSQVQQQSMHQQPLLTSRRFQYYGSRKRQNFINNPMAGPQNSISMRERDQDIDDCNSIGSLNACVDNDDSSSVESGYSVPGQSGSMKDNEGSGGRRRKTLSFIDTIEIIPVYRKSEYNRRSDKNAAFRNLTPDLKTEIRDELNTFKMSEMTRAQNAKPGQSHLYEWSVEGQEAIWAMVAYMGASTETAYSLVSGV